MTHPQVGVFLRFPGPDRADVIRRVSQLRGVSLAAAERLVDSGDALLAEGLPWEVGSCLQEFRRLGADAEVRPRRDVPLSEATPEEMFWELQRRAGLAFVLAFQEDGEC